MNLVIDIGNTFSKWAVFEGLEIIYKDQAPDLSVEILQVNLDFSKISRCIISSTRKKPEAFIANLEQYFTCIWLDQNVKLPFINKYATPKTLGNDRIALAASASSEFANKNVLIIDAGTCITYDILTSENHYLGGAISLGVEMRYKSLNKFTQNLPLLSATEPENIIGDSTESCINSGVLNGAVQEVDGVINQYKKRFENLIVVITGGGAIYFANTIKNNFFARPEFIMKGLNYIVKFNA